MSTPPEGDSESSCNEVIDDEISTRCRATFGDRMQLLVTGPNHISLPRQQKKLAFTLEDVLTQKECEALICSAEETGFMPAGLGASGLQEVNTTVRNSYRILADDRRGPCDVTFENKVVAVSQVAVVVAVAARTESYSCGLGWPLGDRPHRTTPLSAV